jgi:ankyrin repeat protein
MISKSNYYASVMECEFLSAELAKECRFELMLSTRFLWVSLQLERIRVQYTDDELRRFLEELPETLEETYDRILGELPLARYSNQRMRCRSIFAFVACAKRPLSLDELAEALSVQAGDRDYNEDKVITNMGKSLEQLGSLVIFDEVKSSVHFAHHSIRDHILAPHSNEDLREYHIDRQKSELWFGEVCVTYLNFRRFGMELDHHSADEQNELQPKISVQPLQIPEASIAASGDRSGRVATNMIRLFHRLRTKSPAEHTFRFSPSDPDVSGEEPEKLNPFWKYAKENWCWHTRNFQEQDEKSFAWLRLHSLLEGSVKRIELPWAPKSHRDVPPEFMSWAFAQEHTALICYIVERVLSNPYGLPETSAAQRRSILKHCHVRANNLRNERIPPYFNLVLQVALLERDVHLAEHLIRLDGIDVNTTSVHGNALHVACQKGESRIAELLIESGANINSSSGRRGSPLEAAARFGHLGLVRILLKAGADVHWGGPLQAAAQAGSIDLVREFLAAGAVINAVDENGGSSLRGAAESGDLDVVRLLVNAGADPNLGSYDTGYPLHAAALHGHREVVRYLLESGSNINAIGGQFGTALNASLGGIWDMETTTLLLSWGADIHIQAGTHGNALQTAATKESLPTVSELLSRGADYAAVGEGYLPAVAQAVAHGREDIATLLLDRGADINQPQNTAGGKNALCCAAERNHAAMVRFCLEHGAQVNQADMRAQPLHGAARMGHTAIGRILLDFGANVNAEEPPGLWNCDFTDPEEFWAITALHAAAREGRTSFVEMLLAEGADVNVRNQTFPNPLFAAASQGYDSCVKLLLEYGAPVVVELEDGRICDALEIAKYRKFEDTVEVIQAWQDQANRGR